MTGLRLLRASLLADGRGVLAAPGALLLRGEEIVATGSPEAIGQVADAEVVQLENEAILPAFVNPHALFSPVGAPLQRTLLSRRLPADRPSV